MKLTARSAHDLINRGRQPNARVDIYVIGKKFLTLIA